MKYQGQPIFKTPPATCGIHTADCNEHGFGIKKERASVISDAIYQHGDACRGLETGKVDFASFMAGPDLELQSANEILYAGYTMMGISQLLQEWENEAQEYLLAHQVIGELGSVLSAQQHERNGGSSAIFNFGQTGPTTD